MKARQLFLKHGTFGFSHNKGHQSGQGKCVFTVIARNILNISLRVTLKNAAHLLASNVSPVSMAIASISCLLVRLTILWLQCAACKENPCFDFVAKASEKIYHVIRQCVFSCRSMRVLWCMFVSCVSVCCEAHESVSSCSRQTLTGWTHFPRLDEETRGAL